MIIILPHKTRATDVTFGLSEINYVPCIATIWLSKFKHVIWNNKPVLLKGMWTPTSALLFNQLKLIIIELTKQLLKRIGFR